MRALILNSGTGSRMGALTSNGPKCMVQLATGETIISRQLNQLLEVGISRVIITTGKYHDKIQNYCLSLGLPINFSFVKSDKYSTTNYIYSIYLARHLLKDDIVILHGDLVFDTNVLKKQPFGSMAVYIKSHLPEKDFKAVLQDGKIIKVGVDFFENAVMAQPLYKLKKEQWLKWLNNISDFCENKETDVYAENALNIKINPFDFGCSLCSEIDTQEDLEKVNEYIIGLW